MSRPPAPRGGDFIPNTDVPVDLITDAESNRLRQARASGPGCLSADIAAFPARLYRSSSGDTRRVSPASADHWHPAGTLLRVQHEATRQSHFREACFGTRLTTRLRPAPVRSRFRTPTVYRALEMVARCDAGAARRLNLGESGWVRCAFVADPDRSLPHSAYSATDIAPAAAIDFRCFADLANSHEVTCCDAAHHARAHFPINLRSRRALDANRFDGAGFRHGLGTKFLKSSRDGANIRPHKPDGGSVECADSIGLLCC